MRHPRRLRHRPVYRAGLFLVCAALRHAAAEEPCVAPTDADLGLVRALELAQCLQPELRASAARVALRTAELSQVDAAYMPELSSPVVVEHVPGSATGTRAGLELRWTLFDSGRRSAQRAAAEAALGSARHEHEALRQQIFAKVGARYLAATEAQAAARDRERSVRRHGRSLESARHREQAGMAAGSDRLQADAALAQMQLMHARDQGTAREASVALGLAIGLPAEAELRLPRAPAASDVGEVAPLYLWLALARQRHPAVAAARDRGDEAEARVGEAQACGKPSVQLGVDHQRDARQGTTFASLQLHWPLFDGGRCAGQVAAAGARRDETGAELRRSEQDTLGEVVIAHARALGARDKYDAAQSWREAARAALRSSRRRYASGVADIGELLRAEAAMDEAAQARLQCLAQWRSAELGLLAAAGVFNTPAD